jgi:CHASE2 domain-containing sensor protein
MSDMTYFACLVVSVVSGITAIVAARSIIRATGTRAAAIALAISANVGFICTLPFRMTREMPWLPAVGAVLFGSVVLSAILCCLCQIKERTRTKSDE